jgi:type II secretory pathway component PulM
MNHEDDYKILVSKIANIEHMVHEISTALKGNPSLGTVGLAKRIDQVEQQVKAHERKLLSWGVAFAVLIVVVEVLVVWGPKVINQ